MTSFDAGGNARMAINNDAGPILNFYGSDSGWFNFMSVSNTGSRLTSFPGGDVNISGGQLGLNNPNPAMPIDVNYNQPILLRQSNCSIATYTPFGGTCGGGSYVTLQAGVMSNYIALGNMPGIDDPVGFPGTGTMLCCPCGGSCPSLP
jgi:hypothetical protein